MTELNKIQTELNAPKTMYNSFFKGNYRSAEGILEALKPLLKETGCTVTFNDELVMLGTKTVRHTIDPTGEMNEECSGRVFIKSTVTITSQSGESESASAHAELKPSSSHENSKLDPAQMTGSASSYARKYALCALFAIDDNKDPDDEQMSRIREEENKASKKKGQPKTMSEAQWNRTIDMAAQDRTTNSGQPIREWWIENYSPAPSLVKIFDKQVAQSKQAYGIATPEPQPSPSSESDDMPLFPEEDLPASSTHPKINA